MKAGKIFSWMRNLTLSDYNIRSYIIFSPCNHLIHHTAQKIFSNPNWTPRISIHTGLIVETGINIRNHERAQANRAQIACKSVKNRLSRVYYFSYDATSLPIPSIYASFLSFSAILLLLPLSVAVRPPRSL